MSHFRRLSISLSCHVTLGDASPCAQLHAQNDMPTGSVAVVRGRGALLLDDTRPQMKAALSAGMLVLLIGRSADGGLLYVESGTDGHGWVAAGSLLTASVADLPVRSVGNATAAVVYNCLTQTQTVDCKIPAPAHAIQDDSVSWGLLPPPNLHGLTARGRDHWSGDVDRQPPQFACRAGDGLSDCGAGAARFSLANHGPD